MLISGKAFWAKLSTPRPNKFKEGTRQWSFDLSVDEKTQQLLLDKGMRKNYLRDRQDERGVFLTFVRDETKKDGSAGKPFKVVDAHGEPWPDGKLIGNGSIFNVQVTLNEVSFRGDKYLKPSAVSLQVWDLVEFSSNGFPTKEKSEVEESEEANKNW